MSSRKTENFPRSRIATIDVGEVGRLKHHVSGLLELDVSKARELLRKRRRNNETSLSFTAWLIHVIALTLMNHKSVASYLKGNRKRILFEGINVSVAVEKELNGSKVPFPLLIELADKLSISEISEKINEARNMDTTEKDIVLQRNARRMENLYYSFPGFIRRAIWNYLLKHPDKAFRKMGNVAITSLGMVGRVNGWFIPFSVHPVCFGIGSVLKKAVVINDKIEIREILNMTVLLDHDVTDGGPMVRFIRDLTSNIENAMNL